MRRLIGGSRVPCPVPHVPALLAILLIGGSAYAATVDRIVAVVNDDIITEAELSAHVQAFLSGGPSKPSPEQAAQARQAVLRQLIEDRLMLQEARRMKLAVTTEEVDAQLAEVKDRFESEEEFRASMAASGLTVEQFRQRLRDQLLVRKAIDDRVRARISISPQEVAEELGQHPEADASGPRVKLRDLLVRVGEDRSDQEARKLIDSLARQANGGADFAGLAKRYSDDAHAADGGDMGWVAPADLLPELSAAIEHLEPGHVSEPVKTSLGYHLLLLEAKRQAADLAPEEAHTAVFRRVYDRKFQAVMREWINGLLKSAYIEVAQG